MNFSSRILADPPKFLMVKAILSNSSSFSDFQRENCNISASIFLNSLFIFFSKACFSLGNVKS